MSTSTTAKAVAANVSTKQSDLMEEKLKPLGESIMDKPPYASGTLQLPPSCFSLFYKVAKGERAARWIDLANTTPEELEQLTQACERATFGVRHEDVMDESYRKAGKMDTECFSTPLISDYPSLVDIVRDYLLEGSDSTRKIKLELYKLNVYDKGAFFKPHVDTPRSKQMFGSLVLVFPTPHQGGALLLRHQGQEWTFDSAEELSHAPSPSLGYVTFFSDIEHEVSPVTEGHRVTLTYNLYFDDGEGVNKEGVRSAADDNAPDAVDKSDAAEDVPDSEPAQISPVPDQAQVPVSMPEAANTHTFRAAFESLLADPGFLPNGGTLGFGLRHVYQVGEDLKHVYGLLKGSDGVVYRTARALGFEPTLYLYYESRQMWSRAVDAALSEEVLENVLDAQIEDFTRMVRYEGGILVRHHMPSHGDKKPEKVHWVTPVTKYNRKQTSYLAYGNQAEMGLAYGDVCLILRIGNAGDRLAYTTVKQLREEWRQVRSEREMESGYA
ncbi:hypothetical protein BC834DRAFT_972021 [Gloeopeniophorella convolvens]|nr:hypothetical protein BC834DRAFT_972021 [Gloeopeniophorella convolvens]